MSIGSYELVINKGAMPLRVPLKCTKATDSKSFIGVHLSCNCGGRVKQKNYCSECGEEVPYAEAKRLVCLDEKNPELQRVFSLEEYKSIFEKQKTMQIEAIGIVEKKNISSIGVMSSYYLSPSMDKRDKRKNEQTNYFYAMLKEAIGDSFVVVGKVMLRSKENLCVISSVGKGLLMQLMYYNDEIRDNDDKVELIDLSQSDKQMAKQWLSSVVDNKFDYGLLVNEDRTKIIERVMNLIENKEKIVEEVKPIKETAFNNPFNIIDKAEANDSIRKVESKIVEVENGK